MTERDWQKDWEMCQRAIPGPWRWVYYKWTDIYALVGPRDETILDDGSYRGEYDSPGERLITPDDPNGQFIAEAREALPYWLQRVREMENEKRQLVVELCHDEAITMSRAAEILGISLYETEELYIKWLNQRRGDKKHE